MTNQTERERRAPHGAGIVWAIIIGYGLPAIVGIIWWVVG
jgi:hypothetical protein